MPHPAPVPPAIKHISNRPSRTLIAALAVSATCFIFLLATAPRLAIVWDEAYTLERLGRVRSWLSAMHDPPAFARTWSPNTLRPIEDRMRIPLPSDVDSRLNLLRAPVLRWFWPFAREEPHGHPPFYALVALTGDILAPPAPELLRARLGSMLFFALAAGALFAFTAKRWGTPAATVSAAAWALHPHLFALGHYATYDGLLASLWLLTTLAFATTIDRATTTNRIPWPWLAATGLLWGMTLGTKFTGWTIIVPLLTWSLWLRSWRALITLALSGLIAFAAFLLLTPPLWPDPVTGLLRFFASNLSRDQTIPIKTMFLGKVYETPTGSLPWYNTAVWVVFTTPVAFLLLETIGVRSALRHRKQQPAGVLLVLSASTVLILRALPHTPGHDGTRQLAVALGGLAALAGPGLAALTARFRPIAAWIVAAIAVAEGLASVLLLMPVPLSYYSPLIGGLPGATALGMEPTYYWDALDTAALQKLDARTPTGKTLFFASNPITWYYREHNLLKSGVFPFEGRDYAWYIVQNRPGASTPVNRALAHRLGNQPDYILTEKFGVPLIWSFPAPEAEAQFRSERTPTKPP